MPRRPRYRCKVHGSFVLPRTPQPNELVTCPMCGRTTEELKHVLSPLKAIRMRCLICKNHKAEAIRLCLYDGKGDHKLCPLYPHRLGVRPTSRNYPKLAAPPPKDKKPIDMWEVNEEYKYGE